jgi:polycystin 2
VKLYLNYYSFFYQDSDAVDAPIISGLVSTYGRGGYVKNLAQTKQESSDIVASLMNNLWVDRGTRVIFLDFSVYNANINLFCVIRQDFSILKFFVIVDLN